CVAFSQTPELRLQNLTVFETITMVLQVFYQTPYKQHKNQEKKRVFVSYTYLPCHQLHFVESFHQTLGELVSNINIKVAESPN
ncbi:hypothetical protein PJP13_29460, partial [Mycobacterium kansasii]